MNVFAELFFYFLSFLGAAVALVGTAFYVAYQLGWLEEYGLHPNLKGPVQADVEEIELLESKLLIRRRRLRKENNWRQEQAPDPEFYDGFRAAEEYYGLYPKDKNEG